MSVPSRADAARKTDARRTESSVLSVGPAIGELLLGLWEVDEKLVEPLNILMRLSVALDKSPSGLGVNGTKGDKMTPKSTEGQYRQPKVVENYMNIEPSYCYESIITQNTKLNVPSKLKRIFFEWKKNGFNPLEKDLQIIVVLGLNMDEYPTFRISIITGDIPPNKHSRIAAPIKAIFSQKQYSGKHRVLPPQTSPNEVSEDDYPTITFMPSDIVVPISAEVDQATHRWRFKTRWQN
ncbi:hypothetical protein T265_05266 [Opisthorchis viverrini]|uniref:Uncharacterized protein n=1 Tax=Opisthorchis viverrini TaxID=6198 RepID=A0A075AFI5_OPIVI|nr:hypothetical protein T265_05266 [Opisthorchis viverrini]KER27779.1 hypothetical protein T265_05266 [Opisthorchis viverrini]